MIEEFILVQFGAVSRQEEHLDRIDVGKKPARDFSGPVYWMPVRDQEDSATGIVLDQSSKELDKYVGGELLFKDHKIQMALVGNGRYHVAAEAISGDRDHGLLTPKSIAPSHGVIGPKPHLVAQ